MNIIIKTLNSDLEMFEKFNFDICLLITRMEISFNLFLIVNV